MHTRIKHAVTHMYYTHSDSTSIQRLNMYSKFTEYDLASRVIISSGTIVLNVGVVSIISSSTTFVNKNASADLQY